MKRLALAADLNPSSSEIVGVERDAFVSFLPMEAIGGDGTLDLSREGCLGSLEKGYTYLRDGDVAVAKITPCFENGKGALMRGLRNGIGFGTTELIIVRPRADDATGPFLHYMFTSVWFRRLGEAHMYGAGGQKRVPDAFFRGFPMTVPPLAEQDVIAAFLDRETAKIDALVAEQRRLVELLKEKRQAVISHAVTKGLNPDAPTKPSGVEWLGEVPAHWRRTRVKYCLRGLIDTEHKTAPFYDDGEYLVVRTTNIKGGRLVLDAAKYTDARGYEEWTRRGIPQPGDIMFTREAPAGEACLVPEGVDLCMGQRTVLMQVDRALLDPTFGLWSLCGGLAGEFVTELSQGSTVVHFNMSDIKNIPVMLPPLGEQVEIARFLVLQAERFEVLATETELAIALLQERRAALISSAVIGQIDVRGLADVEVA